MQQLATNKESVIIFLSPECPMCQSYSLTLNQLYEKYKAQRINFYGVFVGNESQTEIKNFVEIYPLQFELLANRNKSLATMLHAKVTPEVFVVDSIGIIKYKGSIDNWLFEPGQKREIITEHYLDDALQALVNNAKIKIQNTEAKGCLLE